LHPNIEQAFQRKTLQIEKKKWEPINQKYKANENTSRHNLKEKQKKTMNKNQVKTLCKKDLWL
jgi:hypothetical protein